jgi:3-oxoacyl-[acyl-carrier protein] reductase
MTTLSGKTALVPGASRGIGRSTALAPAKQGPQVLVHYGSSAAEVRKIVAQPDDIGRVIAFLASDAARWITGNTIRVDGGSKL